MLPVLEPSTDVLLVPLDSSFQEPDVLLSVELDLTMTVPTIFVENATQPVPLVLEPVSVLPVPTP